MIWRLSDVSADESALGVSDHPPISYDQIIEVEILR